MKEGSSNKKLLEDYYSLSRYLEEMVTMGDELSEDVFGQVLKSTIVPGFQIARNSGFEI